MIKIIFVLLSGIITCLIAQTELQIQQAKEFIKQTGMTESQAREMAKSKGYSDQEINQVIDNAQNIDVSKKISTTTGAKTSFSDNKNPNVLNMDVSNEKTPSDETTYIEEEGLEVVDDMNTNFETKKQLLTTDGEYYGYNIFKQDPEVFQGSSVGVVDPDYLIGPGDEIIVMLWGETQFRQVLPVDREGFVFIPEIGQVFVNGLNLNLLESKLFRVLSQFYASLAPRGGKATTFLDVSLGKLRPLRVQVLGEVSQPGAYTVNPSTTLFSSLYYFNGPTILGSLRDIRLIRGDKVVTSIDFYDYLFTGKKPKDEKLQLDDVIFIPKRSKSATIIGEINQPGIYELKEGEGLSDLIQMAGNLKITAYMGRIQIDRIVPFNKRSEIGMDRTFIDVQLSEVVDSENFFDINDGDRINVFSILESRQNIVTIEGAVVRPGQYDIGGSLRLSELIAKADSLLGDAYLDRVDIIRTRSDFKEELIELDLNKSLSGDTEHDIFLKGLDRVRVYQLSEMVPDSYVSITGYVKDPGRYLLQENMTLYDLIFKAGGFIDEEFRAQAYLNRAELVRYMNENGKKKIISFDLSDVLNKKGIAMQVLRPNDLIRIYSLSEIIGGDQFVTIKGYVKKPGRYELYQENMTLHDLIFKAVGLEDQIRYRNTFLQRADLLRYDKNLINQVIIPFNLGEVFADYNSQENYRLESGDEIIIYSKKVFNDVRTVEIDGIVSNPGVYKYKKNMTLKDLILEAGGLERDVFRYRVEVARINPNSESEKFFAESHLLYINYEYSLNDLDDNGAYDELLKNEYSLMPFDFITIKPDPNFSRQKKVSINGAVNYPGSYSLLHDDETLADLVIRAGGLKKNANSESSTYLRDGRKLNIDIKKHIKLGNKKGIKLKEGDEINIKYKSNTYQILGEVNVPGDYVLRRGDKIFDAIDKAGGFSEFANKNDIYAVYPNGESIKYKRWLSNSRLSDGVVIYVGREEEDEPFDRTEYAKDLTSIFANFAQAVSIIILARN